MTPNDHPRSLEDLLSGRLDPRTEEAVLAHLSACEPCLAKFEELWARERSGTLWEEPPAIDSGQARRLELRVLRQVHRDDLAAQMIGVYSRGLWVVLLALVVPFKPLLLRPTRA